MQKKIIVAGIGPGDKNFITPAALEKIQAAKFLVGGRRALENFSNKNQITFPITADLKSVEKFISEKRCCGYGQRRSWLLFADAFFKKKFSANFY